MVYRNFHLPQLKNKSRYLANGNYKILRNLSTELRQTVTDTEITRPVVYHKGQVKETTHNLHIGKWFSLHYDLLLQSTFAQLCSFRCFILQTVQ
jgi:hypothetical protein